MKHCTLILAAILSLVLFSCDIEDDTNQTTNSHRVKQMIHEDDGFFEKYEFSYEGSKLVEVMEYEKYDDEAWSLTGKQEFSYSGDMVTVHGYDNNSGNWVEDYKSKYIIKNGLVTEELAFELEGSTWVGDWKWTYQYSGSDLSSWKGYSAYNGAMEQDGKGEFFYEGGLLTHSKEYELDDLGNWSQDDLETFTYENGNIVLWQDFDVDESGYVTNDSKEEYHYNDGKVSYVDKYDWNHSSGQWEFDNTDSYDYNSNGYLVEELDLDGEKKTYEYEEGNGNAKLFWYYPEDLVYKLPTLKSANVGAKKSHVPYYKRCFRK